MVQLARRRSGQCAAVCGRQQSDALGTASHPAHPRSTTNNKIVPMIEITIDPKHPMRFE
jgi:hypothetical protein